MQDMRKVLSRRACVPVGLERLKALATVLIPHAECAVVACRGELLAIRRESH